MTTTEGERPEAQVSDPAPSWHGLARPPFVTIIVVMDASILPLAAIKARLSEIVDRVERHHERITLTRNGRPAAVLMSPEDLEALEDTVELLADPTARTEIEKARKDIARGRGVRADELRARYLNKE